VKTTWCKVPDEAMAQLKAGVLTPREWHVYAILCAVSHYETRVAFTSASELSNLCGIPLATAKRILCRLDRVHGWVRLDFKKGGNGAYQIVVHLTQQLRELQNPVEKKPKMSRCEPHVSQCGSRLTEPGLPDEESQLTRDSSPEGDEPKMSRQSSNIEIDGPCSSRAGTVYQRKRNRKRKRVRASRLLPLLKRGSLRSLDAAEGGAERGC